MIDKETRKKQKQIKKEISQLKKQIKKLEFRPCHNDSELTQKDKDIKTLSEKTYELEKEHDIYILNAGNIKHSL
jgi:septal ring factor EnvC (AmiA/AmiB activator)